MADKAVHLDEFFMIQKWTICKREVVIKQYNEWTSHPVHMPHPHYWQPVVPFYKHVLTFIPYRHILIQELISIYIRYKVWDEITFPLPNFNGATVDAWESIINFVTHPDMITYRYWCQNYAMLVHFTICEDSPRNSICIVVKMATISYMTNYVKSLYYLYIAMWLTP